MASAVYLRAADTAIGGDVIADEAAGASQCPNVVHSLRTFHEKDPVTGIGLGDLRIAIVTDPGAGAYHRPPRDSTSQAASEYACARARRHRRVRAVPCELRNVRQG